MVMFRAPGFAPSFWPGCSLSRRESQEELGAPKDAADSAKAAQCKSRPLPAKQGSFLAEYEVHSTILGTGASGSVREATCRRTGRPVAVKRYSKDSMSGVDLKNMRSEIEVHQSVTHTGIVRLEGVYETSKFVHVVMERLEGGEMFDRIYEVGRLTEHAAAAAALQILQILAYLHSRSVVHRDVKLENLMFTKRGGDSLKLIDFGFATRLGPDRKLSQAVGTPQYVAPEVIRGESYDEKVDIWSLGTVVYTLLTGTPLFGGNRQEIFKRKAAGQVYYSKGFRNKLPEDAQDFVRSLLMLDPGSRPSAAQAMLHPWLKRLAPELPEQVIPQAPAVPETKARERTLSNVSTASTASAGLSRCSKASTASTAGWAGRLLGLEGLEQIIKGVQSTLSCQGVQYVSELKAGKPVHPAGGVVLLC